MFTIELVHFEVMMAVLTVIYNLPLNKNTRQPLIHLTPVKKLLKHIIENT